MMSEHVLTDKLISSPACRTASFCIPIIRV